MNQLLIYFITIITFIIVDAPYLYTNADLYKNRTLAISGKDYTKRYYSAVVVYLALQSGGAAVAAAQKGELGLTGVEGALTAVKSGEVSSFIATRLATILGAEATAAI